jgi:ABC-type transporter Mla subunit MlaD
MASRKKERGNAFLIGLFVLVGAAIMIGIIIWLGANQFFKEQNFYVTYFSSSVEGLETGSAVKYQGVPCGRISKITVAPDGKLVEIIMQIDPNIKINDSLRVQSALAGIAGGKFLQLSYPSPEMAEIYPHFTFTPPYIYIKSSPSGLEEMTIAAQQVMNNLMELDVRKISKSTIEFLENTNKLLSEKELFGIIRNLSQSTQRLNNILVDVQNSPVLENTAQTSDVLFITSTKLQNLVDSLNKQIVNMNLPAYIDKFYTRYDSVLINTNIVISNLGYRSESSLLTLQETLDEFKRTNRELQKTLRAFSDNPSSIFLTLPPPLEK